MPFGGGADGRSVGILRLESRLLLESLCWFFLLFLLSVVVVGVVVVVVISLSPPYTSMDLLYLVWCHALPPPGLPRIYGMKIQVGIVHPLVTFQKKVYCTFLKCRCSLIFLFEF